MQDRELIELAARAAGIVGKWELDKNFKQERWYFNVPYDNQNMLSAFEWNPLRDDGDAFRLAVKCGLQVFTNYAAGSDHRIGTGVLIGDELPPEFWQWHDKDPFAATRKVIVRAAAEIGKICQSR